MANPEIELETQFLLFCEDHGFRSTKSWQSGKYKLSCGCFQKANTEKADGLLSIEDKKSIVKTIRNTKNDKWNEERQKNS